MLAEILAEITELNLADEIRPSETDSTEIEMYRTALDSSPHVESVSIPVNALVGSSDGAFTMTISGDF